MALFVILRYHLLTWLLFCSLMGNSQTPTESKPNIIFIMADDLGYETLACYGNDINNTPNLDKMADQGMKFTHAYSTPLCTPTRVQVMTGKYNFRNYTGFGLLDKEEETFAELLKKEGYVTGVTGKWQLLGNSRQRRLAGGKKGSLPSEAGFDQYSLWQIDTLGSRYKDPVVSTNNGTKTYPGAYGPDIFINFALDFMEDHQDTSFFLYYPMVLTHDPFQPVPGTPQFRGFDPSSRINDGTYFKDMVEYMDMLVGRIINKTVELGIDENTLIIFTGDNGTSRKIVSTVEGKKIKGAKGNSISYGTHVPMIAYWKGVIEPHSINDNLIDFTDLLPTFMEASGTGVPDGFLTDGISFYKQLVGKPADAREWVYCHYAPNWGRNVNATWLHDKNWKLYSNGDFYHIKADPQELKPLPESALTPEVRRIRNNFSMVLKKYEKEYNQIN